MMNKNAKLSSKMDKVIKLNYQMESSYKAKLKEQKVLKDKYRQIKLRLKHTQELLAKSKIENLNNNIIMKKLLQE